MGETTQLVAPLKPIRTDHLQMAPPAVEAKLP